MAVSPATDITAIKGYIAKQDKVLIHQMLNELDVVKDLPVLRNVREPRDLNKMTVDDGVRPLNLDIDKAKGGRKWTKRQLMPQRAMKIIKMVPEELRETWQSEMLDINAQEVPFAQWVWEQEFAKIAEEINDNFYYGKYAGVVAEFSGSTAYVPGSLVYFNDIIYEQISVGNTLAGESPLTHPAKWEDVDNKVIADGPHELIVKALATEGLLTVATGVFNETSAYTYAKGMYDNVKESHRNKKMVAYVSIDVAMDIATHQNTLFGSGQGIAGVDIEGHKEFMLRNTRLTIKPVTWMKASRRIIITMPGNLVVGMNQVSDANKVGKVVDTLHGYRAIVKYMIGCQFRDLEVLYVNDQV